MRKMKLNKRTGTIAGLLCGLMIASFAWAAGTTEGGLHFFEPGEVIQSSLINENFAALDQKISVNSDAIQVLAGLDAETVQQILTILQQLDPEQVQQLVTLLTETEERVTLLEEKCVAVVSSMTVVESTLASHETRLAAVEDKTQFMRVDGTTTIFEGTNIQILDGTGTTEGVNGLGNLIIGYNEEADFLKCYSAAPLRTGSHNLIVGSDNEWTGFGSLVSGRLDRMHGNYCTMLGCGFTLEGWCRFRFRPEFRNHPCDREQESDHEDHND
jgi:hypothetical protein